MEGSNVESAEDRRELNCGVRGRGGSLGLMSAHGSFRGSGTLATSCVGAQAALNRRTARIPYRRDEMSHFCQHDSSDDRNAVRANQCSNSRRTCSSNLSCTSA